MWLYGGLFVKGNKKLIYPIKKGLIEKIKPFL